MHRQLKLGIALGSGAARGWAHIGVLKALNEAGIRPDIVTGTSIGSLVGAAYINDHLDSLEQWLRGLSKMQTARFFTLSKHFNGFINKDKLRPMLAEHVASEKLQIEDFNQQYASVATDLHTGREVWCTDGGLLDSVFASISLPGLFPVMHYRDRWLIDGGLVNPVPVSVCRALGADVVLAINLNGDILGKHLHDQKQVEPGNSNGLYARLSQFIAEYAGDWFQSNRQSENMPDIFDALAASINITQDRITRSRMAGDPPDVLVSPRLAHIGLLEFYRATEVIGTGYQAMQQSMDELRSMLDLQ